METFYLSCAGLGGTVLVLQTLLSFIGLGDRDAEGTEATTIGKVGSVYVAIPAPEGGAGKVQVRLRGRLVGLEAITKDDSKS